MGSRVQDNDTTINTVIDNRNAAGDNALLSVGGGNITTDSGNTTSTTTTNTNTNTQNINTNTQTNNTQHITNTSVDPESLRALVGSIPGIFQNNNALSLGAIDSQRKTTQYAIDAANAATAAIDRNARDTVDQFAKSTSANLSESLRFADQVSRGGFNVVKDLGEIVGMQGDKQTTFASGLVDRVLKETRTGDERQTENFMKYMIYGVIAMAVAFSLPTISSALKGAR